MEWWENEVSGHDWRVSFIVNNTAILLNTAAEFRDLLSKGNE